MWLSRSVSLEKKQKGKNYASVIKPFRIDLSKKRGIFVALVSFLFRRNFLFEMDLVCFWNHLSQWRYQSVDKMRGEHLNGTQNNMQIVATEKREKKTNNSNFESMFAWNHALFKNASRRQKKEAKKRERHIQW